MIITLTGGTSKINIEGNSVLFNALISNVYDLSNQIEIRVEYNQHGIFAIHPSTMAYK